jgi:ATP-binding cassette subfamily B multidrug efflux pump
VRLRRFLKPYSRESILAVVFLLGVVAADLLIPRMTQRIVDEGIAVQDMGVVVTTSLLMLGAAALSALLSIGNTVFSVRAAQAVSADVRSEVVRKVQTFSFGNLDRIQTGQLIVRGTSDVNMVQMIVLMGLRMLIRAPLWMAGSVVMLVTTSPRLALMMAGLVPLILLVMGVFGFKARPLFSQVQEKLERLNTVLQENLAGVRVVKAFVRVDHENERFKDANADLMQQMIQVVNVLSILIPSIMLLLNLGLVGAVWFGGTAVIEGDLTVGQVMASFNYLITAMFPVILLGMFMGPVAAGEASARRILEVLDSEPEVQDRAANEPGIALAAEDESGNGRRGSVAFEDVCFSYNHDCEEPVLNGVSLVAEPGQTVAILGATGSGKSSLVHLIPRFYDVTGGRVTVDGVDVRDLPLHELRAMVGVALQEAVLFTGTIRDNIRYGRPDATDEEVVAAAKAAQAHEFIMEFPDGYDSMVEQRGANLSGGQKQRISIARALLVRPRILILDDTTSSVDVETENKIEQALEELMADSTSFVIAQRISTVLNADKIVVLDRGQVAGEGTHAELMETNPIYREIYESQLGNGRAAGGQGVAPSGNGGSQRG